MTGESFVFRVHLLIKILLHASTWKQYINCLFSLNLYTYSLKIKGLAWFFTSIYTWVLIFFPQVTLRLNKIMGEPWLLGLNEAAKYWALPLNYLIFAHAAILLYDIGLWIHAYYIKLIHCSWFGFAVQDWTAVHDKQAQPWAEWPRWRCGSGAEWTLRRSKPRQWSANRKTGLSQQASAMKLLLLVRAVKKICKEYPIPAIVIWFRGECVPMHMCCFLVAEEGRRDRSVAWNRISSRVSLPRERITTWS